MRVRVSARFLRFKGCWFAAEGCSAHRSVRETRLSPQRREVAAVGPLGRSGEAEQELGLEIVDQRPVALGRGVAELIDDDVVELLAAEPLKVDPFGKGLDRGEQDIGGVILLNSGVHAERRVPQLRGSAAAGPTFRKRRA